MISNISVALLLLLFTNIWERSEFLLINLIFSNLFGLRVVMYSLFFFLFCNCIGYSFPWVPVASNLL